MKSKLRMVVALAIVMMSVKLSLAQRYVGHVSSWNSQTNLSSVNWGQLTDVYYSSINPGIDGVLIKTMTNNPNFAFDMNFFNTIKSINGPKKVWIVLGGADAAGERANRLNTVCSNPTSKATLVNELVNFAIGNNLKGIVIDWEFPDTALEKYFHQILITDLRSKIQALGVDIKLSAMVGGEYKLAVNHLQFINQATIHQLDYVDVLAFQFPSTYHVDHSTVLDVQNSLNAWAGNNTLGISVPKHKLNIGIATFGYNATRTMVREYKDEPDYTTAFNEGIASGLYYNSSSEIENKVKWGMENGYGGVVLFDLLNDRVGTHSYHTVINNSLLKNPLGATFANAIIMGTLPLKSSYKDSKSNAIANNFKNDYGQSSDDIFYQFQLTESAKVSISLCDGGLSTFDTYLYLFDEGKNLIVSNDDNGPLCNTRKSSIVKVLGPGTYYIAVEGFGTTSGNYEMSVITDPVNIPAGANSGNAIFVGKATVSNITYTLTKANNNPSNNYQDDYTTTLPNGQLSDDVYYRIELSEESRLSVNTCQSDFDTYIHVLNSSNQEIAYNDDNGPLCSSTRSSLVTGLTSSETEDVTKGKFKNFLPAGVYYIVVEGFSSNSGTILATVTVETKQFLSSQGSLRSELAESDNTAKITLAPNPATDQFVLTLSSDLRADVEIVNTSGMIVKKINDVAKENTIDVSDLNSGLYMIIIKQGELVSREKLEVIR